MLDFFASTAILCKPWLQITQAIAYSPRLVSWLACGRSVECCSTRGGEAIASTFFSKTFYSIPKTKATTNYNDNKDNDKKMSAKRQRQKDVSKNTTTTKRRWEECGMLLDERRAAYHFNLSTTGSILFKDFLVVSTNFHSFQ